MLDSIGARDVGFGDDLPYRAEAWEAVARGEGPTGDDVADGFFHLARIEERGGERDLHDRFPASASCLDPLDPPLERLRRRLGVAPPRWAGASFAVALTHDVDIPWRWTSTGVRGSAERLKAATRERRPGAAIAEARSLAGVPLHRLRRSDPYWNFERITRAEAARGVRSTFYVMAGHEHPADGLAPEAYDRLRPRLVGTILAGGAEVGLHGSYTAAANPVRLRAEKARLEELAGPVEGHRYHYLRIDPHHNLAPLADSGFAYDTTLGYSDALGFRAGIAHPFRPWDLDSDRPLDLVEIPLAAIDVTLGEAHYLGLSADEAGRRLEALLDWAAANGGGFSLLWHNEWFDGHSHRGWDALYFRLIDAVRERGGVCLSAGELATEAAAWLR